MLPPTLAPSPGSPQLAHSSCCPKPSSLVQLLLHLIPSCHRQISPLSSPHSLLVISSTAILLILKKHPMFLFANGQHSKKEKKKEKKTRSLKMASTNTTHSGPILSVARCTRTSFHHCNLHKCDFVSWNFFTSPNFVSLSLYGHSIISCSEWYYGCLTRPWLLGLWVGSRFLLFIHSWFNPLLWGPASCQPIKTALLKVTAVRLPSRSTSLFSVLD